LANNLKQLHKLPTPGWDWDRDRDRDWDLACDCDLVMGERFHSAYECCLQQPQPH